jgi:hypothetical protein
VILVFSEVTHVNQYDDAGPRRIVLGVCFFARVSTVPRETEGVAVCHCFFPRPIMMCDVSVRVMGDG